MGSRGLTGSLRAGPSQPRPGPAGDRAAIAGPFYQTNRGAVYLFTGMHPCRADLTGDGIADFSDYLEFLNRYDAGDVSVDLNGDGVVDFADYLEFLNFYEAGC